MKLRANLALALVALAALCAPAGRSLDVVPTVAARGVAPPGQARSGLHWHAGKGRFETEDWLRRWF